MKLFTKTSLFCSAIFLLSTLNLTAQITFTNANSEMSLVSTHSGCPTAVVDINGDGLDDIVRLDQAHLLYIDYQHPGQQFDHVFIGDFGYDSGWAWAMCVADVDHNGYKDVLAGGYGPAVKIMQIDNTGTGGFLYSLPTSNFFLQNANFADVNNDGWEDVFACDDDAESHIWLNTGGTGFITSSIINFNVTSTDDSGNYGSVWTDFDNDHDLDLYIAKCRQGVNDPSDGRRIDVLFVNDGNNNYTENAIEYGLNDSAETWTCNFADIDNDGDLDAIATEWDVPSKLLENDGTGHMTNITSGSGFVLSITPLESVMEDFDNDGFVDILVAGSDYQFFHNNGDHTFTELTDVFGTNNMESYAIGDLNHDGKVDVYASYADIYTSPTTIDDVYWMNTTDNGNHFLTLNLVGTTSNEGAYGARAEIYGAWGKQIREVHAGESYGTCNTSNLHFGLGVNTSIDSVIVRWPSGTVTTIINPAADQFITIKEGSCVSPDLTIGASGPLVICPGDSVMLTASSVPADYTYLWSNGSTSQSISVSSQGEYSVEISAPSSDECPSTSASVLVQNNPDETPIITAVGDLSFCEGGSVTLSSSTASSYDWSTGATSQSIDVSESGLYTVTVAGACQQWTSDPINVTVLQSPAPGTQDVYLSVPGVATLNATGNDISWYDVPTGGSPVGTGSSFTTPFLNDTTTYYAEDAYSYNGDTLFTGQYSHAGSLYSGSNSTNAWIDFDVMSPCILKSVKVITNVPGNRLIEWRNYNGGVIQSAMIYVPNDSSRIQLNFNLTPGSGYQLGTNTNQNNILLGYDSPHLQRSDAGVDYPYTLNDLVSLTGSPFGPDTYYYFYDWEIQKYPTICVSDRAPATVFIGVTGIQDPDPMTAIQAFPNPTDGILTLSSNNTIAGEINMQLIDVTGRIILSKISNGLKSGETVQLNLTSFAKGIYYLNVKTDGGTIQHKVVIQ